MSATFNLDGGDVPWTTTPELRLGPGAPYTDPSLQVNLFFRVSLGFTAIFVSLVPAKLLWLNGEFAATIFCLSTAISNFFYVVNALIWHDDNVETWSAGYGWCDLQVYFEFALQTSYNICLFEIMRGLASKVAVQRLGSLTAAEKRRQHIISAIVIFTLPVLQMVLTYFVLLRRYNVSTLAGCSAVYDPNWIFLLFFVIPAPLFVFGAGVMTVVAFRRVREIHQASNSVMHFRDSAQLARQRRVKRKLYFLSFSVLLVVLPLVGFFFVANILEGMPWTEPYDFKRTHFGPSPNNIYTITFTTTNKMSFGDLNFNYIPILSGIAVFISFGTTTEAYNEYRKCLLFLGLGTFFPKLHDEYKPTPPSTMKKSWWSSFTDSLMSKDGSKGSESRKGSLVPTAEHVSFSKPADSKSFQPSCSLPTMQSFPEQQHHSDDKNPWPDLTLEEIAQHQRPTRPAQRPLLRNPFKPFQLPVPSGSISSFLPITRKKKSKTMGTAGQQQPVMSRITNPAMPFPSPAVVRGDDYKIDLNLETMASIQKRDDEKRYRPLHRFDAAGPGVGLDRAPRVDTRVWSEPDAESSVYSMDTSKSSMMDLPSRPFPALTAATRIGGILNRGRDLESPPCPLCSRLIRVLENIRNECNVVEGGSFEPYGQEEYRRTGEVAAGWGGVVVETSIARHSMRGDEFV
ncbi:pheromone receptor 1 [Rhypophila sp. PSN 637]